MRTLPRFSFGVGDRFGHEATAQLAAFQQLARDGIQVAPVWNKSHREHGFIGSKPADVRTAAAAAISESGLPSIPTYLPHLLSLVLLRRGLTTLLVWIIEHPTLVPACSGGWAWSETLYTRVSGHEGDVIRNMFGLPPLTVQRCWSVLQARHEAFTYIRFPIT